MKHKLSFEITRTVNRTLTCNVCKESITVSTEIKNILSCVKHYINIVKFDFEHSRKHGRFKIVNLIKYIKIIAKGSLRLWNE